MFTLITEKNAYRVNPAYLTQFKANLAAKGIEVLAVEQDKEEK